MENYTELAKMVEEQEIEAAKEAAIEGEKEDKENKTARSEYANSIFPVGN